MHPFFEGIDWAKLATGKMPSPWIPTVAGSLDTSQFDQEFTSMMPIGTCSIMRWSEGKFIREFSWHAPCAYFYPINFMHI
jgi:hypothetical protein